MASLVELCFAELVSQVERYRPLREQWARLRAEERLTRERIGLYESLLVREGKQDGA